MTEPHRSASNLVASPRSIRAGNGIHWPVIQQKGPNSKDPRRRERLPKVSPRSSSREVRIRVPDFFSVVDFSRGTHPTKKGVRPGT